MYENARLTLPESNSSEVPVPVVAPTGSGYLFSFIGCLAGLIGLSSFICFVSKADAGVSWITGWSSFRPAVQYGIGFVTAALSGQIVGSLVREIVGNSTPTIIVVCLLSFIAGIIMGTVFAAFPAASILLCMVSCPDDAAFPRPYNFWNRGRRSWEAAPMIWHLILTTAILSVLFVQLFGLVNDHGFAVFLNPVCLCVLFFSVLVVVSILLDGQSLSRDIPKSRRKAACLMRVLWVISWLELILCCILTISGH